MPERAENLRQALGAERVTLNRFVAGGRQFEIVGCAGRSFLAPGVRISTAEATILVAASRGEFGWRTRETSCRLLDRVALSMGLGSSCSMPLRVGDRVVGAISVMWRHERPPIDDPERLAAGVDAGVLATLAAPRDGLARVLVCHEHELLGRGLACVIREHLGAHVSVCTSLSRALAATAARPPQLLVCSEHFSPDRSLAEVVADLRAAGADAPLLVVASCESAHSLYVACRAGAAGYVPGSAGGEQLLATMLSLLEGERALRLSSDGAGVPRLTSREREILRGVDRGLSDKELARELGVSLSTVKTHARRIYAKLGVSSRTAALHRARCSGLL